MGLEATGGLERAVPSALAPAGLPGVGVHPRQGREVARATGPLATTEAVEARALAPCAAGIRPPPRPRPAAQTQARRALVGRRQPLGARRTAEPHRLAGTRRRLQTDSEAPLTGRTAGSATLDDALATLLRARPLWRETDELWQSATGMGPVSAPTLRRALPEWGPLTRQEIAAVVGVAPRNGDSGTRRGQRTIWGGRAQVRTVGSMSTRVATRCTPQITGFDERLLAAGTVKKVALTACMRQCVTILHAMLKHRTPWHPQEVQS
jgi:transposase